MTVEKTKVNYKPLWKLLIDKELSKAELRKKTSIARSTIVKMANNEYVSMDVLVRICIALDCGMDDIVEVEFEEDGEIEKYKLVTSIRGNSMENRISIESPLGRALKGHKAGERVKVRVSEDISYYLIIRSIEKTGEEGENIRGF